MFTILNIICIILDVETEITTLCKVVAHLSNTSYKEVIVMSDNSFKDKVEGTKDKIKGAAKEAYGKVTDDASKKVEGKKDQLKGEAKSKVGEVKDAFKNKDEK